MFFKKNFKKELTNKEKKLEKNKQATKERVPILKKSEIGGLENKDIALFNNFEERVAKIHKKEREEKDRLLAIFKRAIDGFLVFDQKNKLVLINSQAEKIFNVNSKEIIGKTILDIASFDSNFKLLTDFIKNQTKIEKTSKKEIPIREDLILDVSVISLTKERKEIGALIVLRDITREKAMEKAKIEFVALSAHQLRMPLSAIKWSAKMLSDEEAGELTKEQKEYLDKIYQSNERMIVLINNLLDVTKIEEGRYIYRPTMESVEKLIELIIKNYKEEIKIKNINLKFKKPVSKIPETRMDIEKINLVIENLLNNALRYTPVNGRVIICLKCDIKEIEFSIKDSGIGIPEDQKKEIFTKFFRAANARQTEPEGSGLGLFIAKNIIEAHKGRIWFETEENKGTTFYFTLPIKK